jgi:hypothetical protein
MSIFVTDSGFKYVIPQVQNMKQSLNILKSQNKSYVTNDGQSVSLSWCQAPIWGPRPDFYQWQLQVCWCRAPSLMRGRVCRSQLLLALTSAVILGTKSRGSQNHILLSQIQDSPNLVVQVLVFISPRNRVAQLNPQVLDSLFVSFCDSQGYGGGIRTSLHAGNWLSLTVLLITPWHGPHRKHRSCVAVSSCCSAKMLVCKAVTQ